mmetsp:Transcript_11400/g.16884  ORF Transcript_11400/g.16884 Transcript_11400/m.16884 type:complete len:1381 (+) Transcript_11400:92-4234(+)
MEEYKQKKQAYLQMIKDAPTSYEGYFNLATLLTKEEKSIKLLTGEKHTKKSLFLKAIELEPKQPETYFNLATSLETNETVQIPQREDGKQIQYDRKKLYLKVLSIDKKDAAAYNNLATEMGALTDTIEFLDGSVMTKEELYLTAIDLKPYYPTAYFNLANDMEQYTTNETNITNNIGTKQENTVTLYHRRGTYSKKQLYQRVIMLSPEHGEAYLNLALMLDEKETIKIEDLEGTFDKKRLMIKGMHVSPQLSELYNNLAVAIKTDEKITLMNGDVCDRKELYLRAIDIDPQNTTALYNLSIILKPEEPVMLKNGRVVTAQFLYSTIIEVDPKKWEPYYYLALSLKNTTNKIKMPSGKDMDKKSLLLKVIELNKMAPDAFNQLGLLLDEKESVTIKGETLSKTACFLKEIDHHPNKPFAYNNLANIIKEKITLLNGEITSKKDLYIKAIDIAPHSSKGYLNLAILLENNETIMLLNQESLNKVQLYLKVLDLAPNNVVALYNLAQLLIEYHQESVPLLNKTLVTPISLLTRVIEQDESDAHAYITLGNYLPPNGSVTLHSGKRLSKRQLYVEALAHTTQEMSEVVIYNLANDLQGSQRVMLSDGKMYNKKQLLCRALCIEERPRTLNNLGTSMADDEIIQFGGNKWFSKRQIFLLALSKDPNHSESYNNLAATIQNDEETVSFQNKSYNRRQLYLRAIEVDPNNTMSIFNLSQIMDTNDSITIKDKTMSRKELLQFVIEKDPTHALAFLYLSEYLDDETTMTVNDCFFDKRQMILHGLSLNPDEALGYLLLSQDIENEDETVVLFDKPFQLRDIYIRCIELDPSIRDAYAGLAELLDPGEQVSLKLPVVSKPESKPQPPSSPFASSTASPFQSTTKSDTDLTGGNDADDAEEDAEEAEESLFQFVSYTLKELFIKMIELDPDDANAYVNLASEMDDETVSISSLPNRLLNRRHLLVLALERDPVNPWALYNLAQLLDEDPNHNASIKVKGSLFTARDLYVSAFQQDPSDLWCLFSLSLTLRHPIPQRRLTDKSKKLPDQILLRLPTNPDPSSDQPSFIEQQFTRRQLLIYLIECVLSDDSLSMPSAFLCALGDCLSSSESTVSLDNNLYTQEDLFLWSIDVDPSFSDAYRLLAYAVLDPSLSSNDLSSSTSSSSKFMDHGPFSAVASKKLDCVPSIQLSTLPHQRVRRPSSSYSSPSYASRFDRLLSHYRSSTNDSLVRDLSEKCIAIDHLYSSDPLLFFSSAFSNLSPLPVSLISIDVVSLSSSSSSSSPHQLVFSLSYHSRCFTCLLRFLKFSSLSMASSARSFLLDSLPSFSSLSMFLFHCLDDSFYVIDLFADDSYVQELLLCSSFAELSFIPSSHLHDVGVSRLISASSSSPIPSS